MSAPSFWTFSSPLGLKLFAGALLTRSAAVARHKQNAAGDRYIMICCIQFLTELC